MISSIYGCKKIDVEVGGSAGFAILPNSTSECATPWVWYAPTFVDDYPGNNLEWINTRLLAAGMAICGVEIGESFGNPQGRSIFTEFHRHVVSQFGLTEEVCLWAQSRGGLMLHNWAAEHPELINCIGGTYTVCSMASYPGIEKAAPAYGMTPAELASVLKEHNPIDRLEQLAAHKIPILHIHGDNDITVPLEENSLELAQRYEALGGPMRLIIVEGKGHEEIPEFFERQEMVDFFVEHGTEGK